MFFLFIFHSAVPSKYCTLELGGPVSYTKYTFSFLILSIIQHYWSYYCILTNFARLSSERTVYGGEEGTSVIKARRGIFLFFQ